MVRHVQTWWVHGASVRQAWWGDNRSGFFHHMCVSLISAITWLAFCNACWQDLRRKSKWKVNSSGRTTHQSAGVSPVACRRTPCAAGPCPPIRSAGHWGGQIYTAGQQARSGGCLSHGWPRSASLPSAHWGGEGGREREETNRTDGWEQGCKIAGWLCCPPDGGARVWPTRWPRLSKYRAVEVQALS